jgi:hypothetical protein
MRMTRVLLMLLFGVLTTGRILTADTIAVLPGSGGFENSNYGSDVTLGWQFTVSVQLTLTALGYFDAGGGLTDSHPVGVWDSLGNLIAEGTVPSGTGTNLVDGFRMLPITPVPLAPGTYTIGGYANVTSPDPFEFQAPSITTVAGLSFVQHDLFTQGSTLTEPTSVAHVFTPYGYFGPDFLVTNGTVTTVDAPEPRSILLILLGLAVLAVRRRSRGRAM